MAAEATFGGQARADDFGDRSARVWECVEYSLTNTTWAGNPFDLVATVTFRHADESRITEMFYAGDDTWKFGFTGTRTGVWKFSTSSGDADLHGHSGSVTVSPRVDPSRKGFLTHVGNKFAVMEQDADHLEGYVYQVFMNQQDYEQQYEHSSRILGHPSRRDLIDDYWNNTRDNGFDIYFFAVFYSWYRTGALSIDDFSSNADTDLEQPDLALFDTLEQAIRYAHERGGRTHIWAWGDNDRKQTPNHLADGFRGGRHRRLIRYIAARLGPLPGWAMNFGFDTVEMPNAEADGAWWADELNRTMGWPHILTSRGWDNESFGAHSYAGFGGSPYDLKTTDKGPAGYREIRHHLEERRNKPSIYEERHTYNRWKCWPVDVRDPDRLNETGSRRLIWWEAMAGGMGGFFGHFSERFNQYGPFRDARPCSYHPDSLKRAFRTHREFWKGGRLLLSMSPDDRRIREARGYCLAAADRKHFVFFVEDASSVTLDLHGMPGSQPVRVVNATADYDEIDKGTLTAGIHTIRLRPTSDWALAVGKWGAGTSARTPSADPRPPRRKTSGLRVVNGWYVHDGDVIWGHVQHNGWWRPGQRPNLTRRAPGQVGPNRTEDLEKLTDAMLRFGYPGFEHNFGLWYDRRRDRHDTSRRTDDGVVPPFLEQPWARSGEGTAWDGLSKYDLTTYNDWYFQRVRQFADLCDQKGTVLLFNFYMQHALLETNAHYVDFPWRPANCVQATDLPGRTPAANAFYDVSHPLRRKLHRAYIRKCLDVLGRNTNVVFLCSEEYTGPLSFMRFWLDTVFEWERETGRDVHVGLGAPKDVMESVMADPSRAANVSTVDLRYWWYEPDGTLFAPAGGREVAGRYLFKIHRTSPEQMYRQVNQCRRRYPRKGIIHGLAGTRQHAWAALMGGASLLVGQMPYPEKKDPAAYISPERCLAVRPTYDFIRGNLSRVLPRLRPHDLVKAAGPTWCLADPGRAYLVYALRGGQFELDLSTTSGRFASTWFDPRTGEQTEAGDGEVQGRGVVSLTAPDERDWGLWLNLKATVPLTERSGIRRQR